MRSYEDEVKEELFQWHKQLDKKSSLFNRLSKKAQTKMNEVIPEKAHQVITESIKKMVEATLIGSEYTTRSRNDIGLTLKQMDMQVQEKLKIYRRTAAIEGAGTGAGGILLGLADFPLLLSIKMKFLFEAGSIYGFDTKQYEERLFILYIFQLAFSSDKHRRTTLKLIENWELEKTKLVAIDWRIFQQEYRDYIDLVKMLQLLPGIGAIVGAFANYQLLEHLGETAMNCYRMRLL